MKIAAFVTLAYSVSPLDALGAPLAKTHKAHQLRNGGKPRQPRRLSGSGSGSGSGTTSKSKSTKHSKKSSRDHPEECADLQDGFQCGMAPEVTGLWLGDEKFFDDSTNTTFDYCSRALFNPAEGENFLTWNGGYVDCTGDSTCLDIGVDALAKTIDGSWMTFLNVPESYILQIEQKRCIDDCSYDVASQFPGYTVQAKACGAHLKKDSFRPDEFSCELYQTNLIEDANGNQEVVVVLTYYTYFGGYDNFVCPERVSYDRADLEGDPNAQGMTLFVLQANGLTDSTNTTNWDCLVDDNIFD